MSGEERTDFQRDDDIEVKLRKYERFIDEKLRPDLEKVLVKRD